MTSPAGPGRCWPSCRPCCPAVRDWASSSTPPASSAAASRRRRPCGWWNCSAGAGRPAGAVQRQCRTTGHVRYRAGRAQPGPRGVLPRPGRRPRGRGADAGDADRRRAHPGRGGRGAGRRGVGGRPGHRAGATPEPAPGLGRRPPWAGSDPGLGRAGQGHRRRGQAGRRPVDRAPHRHARHRPGDHRSGRGAAGGQAPPQQAAPALPRLAGRPAAADSANGSVE